MKKSIILIAAIAMFIGLNSCQKGDTTVDPSNPMMVSQVLPDAVMPAFDASSVDVYGSIDEQINVYPEFNGNREGCDPGRMGNRMREKMGFGFKMRGLFHQLQLTDAQITAVHDIMIAYHDCVHGVMSKTESQRADILKNAAAARKLVLDDFKNKVTNTDGSLKYPDRASVRAAITAINQKVRTDLQALIDQAALCDCFKAMLRSIYGVVKDKPDQVALYKKWLAGVKNDCIDSTFDPSTGN